MNYSPSEIEPKWQHYWQKSQTFQTGEPSDKPKYYILDMFPYPSGSGLHVGHGIGYTVTDIIARYKRMQGFQVLHPMGWDSFGLPAEQYAIRTGTHPAQTTKLNIERFKEQLHAYGYSYDWTRELKTSEPSYYKWTQWIFTLLYERGLAYQAHMHVNYCPYLATVLANEEVENGKSVEGGHPVERRALRQWVLKITEYADRLLKDLELIDWPENLKKQQQNWIGRSEGAIINFVERDQRKVIQVFTTRVDTIFGVTYLVLAPEHPLVDQITHEHQRKRVQEYQKLALQKSDLSRTDLNKDKTGVFTGAYALHPMTQEPIPIWIADYVLANYATGAVMAVPSHDSRDAIFAKQHQLKFSVVIEHRSLLLENKNTDNLLEPYCEDGYVINSCYADLNLNGLSSAQARTNIYEWLELHQKGQKQVSYKLRDWLFSRQRYWGEPIPILHFEDASARSLTLDELPLTPPEIIDYKPSADGQSPLAKERAWIECVDSKTGKKAWRETNTMPQWAGSCWYYLRFVDPHNTQVAWDPQKERHWMPVDTYVGGAEHAVLHLLFMTVV
jgi:leucyl-tRNA synthetase